MKMKNVRKKSIALVAGLVIVGTVGASAATLNGLGDENLGADAADVVSCDTNGVDLSYNTSFDSTSNEYEVDSVTVSSVAPACDGQAFSLTLTDGSSILGLTETGTVVLASGAFDVSLDDGVSAEAVTLAALSISGSPAAP